MTMKLFNYNYESKSMGITLPKAYANKVRAR